MTKEINKNIEITNTWLKMTQLNKLARRDVEKTRLREKSRLQTNIYVRMIFLTKKSVVVNVAVFPQHRIGASGLSPKLFTWASAAGGRGGSRAEGHSLI